MKKKIRSISSLVSQKIGLLRKSFRIFGDHDVLLKCFNSFILPCLEYRSCVWSSAADSHLNSLIGIYKLVNFKFQILQLVCSTVISLAHCVYFTRSFYETSQLVPSLESPRGSFGINSLSFSPTRLHTFQYSRWFHSSYNQIME